MKNTKELGLSDYKHALPMSELLQSLGLEGPNGSGKILCPFHDESTPSCHVYDSHLYCYGCGVSMDSIDLVMTLEEVGFKDALRRLAKLADLPDPDFNGDMETIHRKQAEIAVIYARFFEKSKENSAHALDYLQSRGITPDTIQNLDVGYFPVGYELDDEDRELAKKAGLVAKSGNFLFNAAVVFPITYGHRVMSLYGRMHDDVLAPRHVYPRTTDPPMPAVIWGLDDCWKEEEIFVVEGIIDAHTLRSRGINNSVSVFGTQGLTRERQKLLRKTKARRINLAFDNDANGSGDSAVLKTGKALAEAGFVVKVITLPRPSDQEKVDINSYFKDHRREDFLSLSRKDFFDVFVDSIPTSEDTQTQFQNLQPALELISQQPEPTWSLYLDKVHGKFPGFHITPLKAEIKKLVKSNKANEPLNDKKFKPLPYAERIMSDTTVLYYAGNFYRYEGGVYMYWHDEQVDRRIIDIIGPDVQSHQIDSAKRILKDLSFRPPEEVNKTGVFNAKNGLLDLNSGEFRQHSPEILSTVQSEVSFDPTAEWTKWKEFLDFVLPDEDLQMLLGEIFGYCLTTNISHHKAFFLSGEGNNGKSVGT